MIGRGDTRSANAKGLPEFDEVRINEIGCDYPALEAFALVAPHIAIRIVIEHKHDYADLELHGGRQFLHAEHEAALARDRNPRPAGMCDLGAERGRKA